LGWVSRELRELGIPPLKRFGQHFLLSQEIRDRLIDEAQLSAEDTVVEVGPGLGFVTAALAAHAGNVVAIEKDRTLAWHLRNRFSTAHNVQIIEGDGLSIPYPVNAKIVSSPPYNISSKLVLRILSSQFRLACLLLQEDFVRRLTASSGSRDYGRLTVMLQTRARAEHVSKVPRSAFYPQPRVDSAITTIRPTPGTTPAKDDKVFEDLVRALFTQRRRKVQGVLSRYLAANYRTRKEKILTKAEVGDKRVYELTPFEFIRLSDLIADSIKD
jgi:16S rRNA (adenine1518-N6/adenine1519-N6)-dimethyltransferase